MTRSGRRGEVVGLVLSAAVLGTFVLSGCGSGTDNSTVQHAAGQHRAKTYSSVSGLAEQVQAVDVVSVLPGTTRTVPADETGQSPMTSTVVTVRVERRLRGQLVGDLDVRLGTADSGDSEDPPALKPGADYVLFLTPFEWHPGQPTGQWTVPGGLYEVTDSGQLRLVSPDDPLPATFGSVEDLVAALPA